MSFLAPVEADGNGQRHEAQSDMNQRKSKYGNLSSNRDAVQRRAKQKFFDSADWMLKEENSSSSGHHPQGSTCDAPHITTGSPLSHITQMQTEDSPLASQGSS